MTSEELQAFLGIRPRDFTPWPVTKGRWESEQPSVQNLPKTPPSPTALVLDEWDKAKGEEFTARQEKDNLPRIAGTWADLHGVAFKPDPQLAENFTGQKHHQEFVKNLLENPDCHALRQSTVYNPIASEMATVTFGREFAEYCQKLNDLNEKKKKIEKKGGKVDPERQQLKEEMACLRSVSNALEKAQEEVQEFEDSCSALGIGGDGGRDGRMDLAKVQATFKQVKNNYNLRRILQLAGRYRRVAQGKQRTKTTHGMDDMVGVTLGGDIGRLLPSELACLGDPDLELDAMRRIVERQALCREYRGVERVGKGPIVVCVDECLHPNSKVAMADGSLKRIAEVKEGEEVLSFDFSSGIVIRQKVGRVAKIPSPQTICQLTTPDSHLTASWEHRVFVVQEGKIAEKQLKEIQKGEMIALARKLPPDPRSQEPDERFLKMAQVVGYLLGDGHSWHDKKANSKSVAATDKDVENLEVYQRLLFALGYKPLIRHWGGRNRLKINSAAFYNFLHEEFPGLLNRSPKRVIPQQVYRWPNVAVASFLRGLFDAESNVADHQISITMSSKNVIDGVQTLLRRFGIITSRDTSDSGFIDHNYHRLLIGGRESLHAFFKEIGYGSRAKETALRKVLTKNTQKGRGREQRTPLTLQEMTKAARSVGVRYPKGTQLPRGQKTISKDLAMRIVSDVKDQLDAMSKMKIVAYDDSVRQAIGISQEVAAQKLGTMRKVLRRISRGVGVTRSPDLEERAATWLKREVQIRIIRSKNILKQWKRILTKNLLWTRVRGVKGIKSQTRHLYDLTMDGPVANYIANGYVVHNSGSMRGNPIANAKAFALAMAWVAKHQRRWIALVGYSGGTTGTCLAMAPNKWNQEGLLRWLEHFYSGGTTMDVPLEQLPNNYWPNFLKEGMPRGKTDTIIITDAIVNVPPTMANNWNAWKQKEKVRCITLVIGAGEAGDLAKVSDEVHFIRSIEADGEAVGKCLSI